MGSKTSGKETHNAIGGIPISANLALVLKAERAILWLVDHGSFWSGSKEQFAIVMDWNKPDGTPDRRQVEDVCNLTRDQEHLAEWVQQTLGGMEIAYSPSDGGMVLVDPGASELPLLHYAHVLAGDMARQRQTQTENRRRLPTWRKTGSIAANGGDHELARLCWQAEDEIKHTGFIQEGTTAKLFQVLSSRQLIGQ